MKKRMSRAWAIVLCVIISVAYMPMSVFADDAVTATVRVIVQEGVAILADQVVTATSTTADDYGYEDKISTDKVSALDALVACHVAVLGDDKEAVNAALTMSGNNPGLMFGEGEGMYSGFAINKEYVLGDDGYGANLADATVEDADVLDCFWYEDEDWGDYITTFGEDNMSAEAGEDIPVTLTGYMYMAGYGPHEFEPIEDAAICSIDEDGNIEPMMTEDEDFIVTDEDGVAHISFDVPGTYKIGAMDYEFGFRIISPICEITVTEAQDPVEPAADADVTVSIANAGKFAKAADGSLMIDKTVTVSDINKDGKLDLNEALIAAHEKYNADGKDAYNSYYNDTYKSYSVNKLWGVDTYSLGFYKNGAITAAVDQEEVAAGDDIYAFIYADQANWSDVYSAFDKKVAKATVGKPMSLTLSIADWKGSSVYGGATIGIIDPKTGDVTPLKAMTDDNGVAKVTLTKAGTTILTAIPADGGVFTPTACVVTVGKGTQSFKVSTKTKTVSAKKVKKASRTTSAVYVSGVKGKAKKSFYKVGGSKKLTISKTTGKIKVKKGTKKGTYKIKIKVKTAATANYVAGSKTVTVKVRVK